MAIKSYRDLVAWQKACELAKIVYGVAGCLLDYEKYALASQTRRAATSVYGNIAEGFGTGTRPRFLNQLRIARGSLAELDGYVRFIKEHHRLPVPDQLDELLAETSRVLQGLISSLEGSERPAPGSTRRNDGPLVTSH